MKLWTLGCAAALGIAAALPVQGAIVVQYNGSGSSGTAGAEPVSLAATANSSPNVTASSLTRGSGIGTAALANGYSGNNWDPTNSTQSAAVAANDFFQWSFTVNSGFEADISSFDATLRRSAIDGPKHFALQYSFDGFATAGATAVTFNYFGRNSGTAPGTVTPFQWMTTDTPGQTAGNRISQQDLSGVAALQDIAGGTTVTFRLYGWGDGAGATSNTVALGRNTAPLTADNGNGEAGAQLNGVVTAVPEPMTAGVAGLFVLGALIRRRR
jgi:hypothetical protein